MSKSIDLCRLPPATRDALDRVRRACADQHAALYVVGGAVRDLMLGRDVADIDVACDLPVAAMREIGHRAGADAVYLANDRFETVGLRFGAARLELTRFRGVSRGAAAADALRNDLALRDFTINAMAFAPPEPGATTAQLIDPFDGATDLRQHTLRGVVDPLARLREDPLRVLRAVRLAAQLRCVIEASTRHAVAIEAPGLATVSVERISGEINRLLLCDDPVAGLRLMVALNVLSRVLPELVPLSTFQAPQTKELWTHTLRVVANTPADLVTRWSALLHDAAKPQTYSVSAAATRFHGHELAGAKLARSLLSRLRADTTTVTAVARVVEAHGRPAHYDSSWTDGAVRRLMLDLEPWLGNLLDLARADVTSARADVQARARLRIAGLEAHIERLRSAEDLARLVSPLDGNELIALFERPPGPWIRAVKDRLRDLVIDGQLDSNDKKTATALATAWLADGEPSGATSK